jgi:predicted neuraminidase
VRQLLQFTTILLLAAAASAQPAAYQAELLFPQEPIHNHSSSIVELPNGDLLVAWFHGSGERTADDTLIQAARWNHETKQWGERYTFADTPGFPDTNPMLFIDSKQRLFLFWPAILANEWYTALMKYRISTDYADKPVWSFQDNVLLKPKDIQAKAKSILEKDLKNPGPFAQRAAKLIALADDKYFSRLGWFTRTHVLELPTGRLLLPLYSDGYSWSLIGISDDGGLSWTASEPIVGYGNIQPSLVRKHDGTIVAYMRDNGPPPKRAHIATSQDDGVTWTGASDTDIPNPGTSLEAIALKNGHWIMVYNDLESQRYSLAIALSEDEGQTWKYKRHLDGDPSTKSPNQYHYPSVIQAKDGSIHVTYSYFTAAGKSIKHVRLDESWIRQN